MYSLPITLYFYITAYIKKRGYDNPISTLKHKHNVSSVSVARLLNNSDD